MKLKILVTIQKFIVIFGKTTANIVKANKKEGNKKIPLTARVVMSIIFRN